MVAHMKDMTMTHNAIVAILGGLADFIRKHMDFEDFFYKSLHKRYTVHH